MRARYLLLLIAALLYVLLPASSVFALNVKNSGKISQAAASLRSVGNQILLPSGKAFIPEGISVYGGLEDTDYMENIPNIMAQIKAAVIYWHTNTIRLQVAESNLFANVTPGKSYNVKFLNLLVKLVDYARSLNQAVVINDQTEFTTNMGGPTAITARFWRVIGDKFANKPFVIFDLFNEPREGSISGKSVPVLTKSYSHFQILRLLIRRHSNRKVRINSNLSWQIWKYGGELNGIKYIGMQELVNQIRYRGISNLIWVEGPDWAYVLPKNKNLLSGDNIEYSFHHINLNRLSSWLVVGKLAKIRPVVDGEWSQYQSPWEECFVSSPTTVPKYLAYLKAHNVGLVAWSLQPGSLLKGIPGNIPANNNSPRDTKKASNMREPSRFSRDYACNNHFGQGAGALIKQYFINNAQSL